jgi:2,3-dihydroxyphenylpropionate 1,2-dioxygenase
MAIALCALSHSPLFGIEDPPQPVIGEVHAAVDALRQFVADFEPEVTVIFGPDHFNGVFYDLMPPFCVGVAAAGVGDWGTTAGPLNVDRVLARKVVGAALASGIDVSHSERLHVDHGMVQPLDLLFGPGERPSVIPIFINCVGLPLGPVKRVRLLGEAVGAELASWNKRVLVIASGGLSHDPPVPQFDGAPPELAARLIDGRNPTPEMRALRQQRVIEAGRAHAAGDTTYQQINPAFDKRVLDTLAAGELDAMDSWSNELVEREGGHSGHEIRPWLAAFAALSAAGAYQMDRRWYWPVKEWMTGFAFATATSKQ